VGNRGRFPAGAGQPSSKQNFEEGLDMKSFYDAFGTDENLEKGEGVDLDYGDCGIITIHRAGGSNKKFGSVFAAKLRPYERQMQMGTLEDGIAERLLAEAYAEAVIVGWRGVKNDQGKALAFEKKNVVKLLLDLPELFRDIQEQAQKAANFRRAGIEDAAKNSPSVSASS